MTISRTTDYLTGLERELYELPRETEWGWWKEKTAEPHLIGDNHSALANNTKPTWKEIAW
jgi:hypothetical protein